MPRHTAAPESPAATAADVNAGEQGADPALGWVRGGGGERPRPALLVPAPPPDPTPSELRELRGCPGALQGRSSLGGGESAPTESVCAISGSGTEEGWAVVRKSEKQPSVPLANFYQSIQSPGQLPSIHPGIPSHPKSFKTFLPPIQPFTHSTICPSHCIVHPPPCFFT